MGIIIPVGFGQFVLPIKLVGDPETMVITMGFEDDSGLGFNAKAEALQDALFDQPSFAASSIADDYTLGPATVTVVGTLGPQVGVATTTRVGSNALLEPPPQNCSWLIQKRTARGGRAGRGRFFLPLCNVGEGNVSPTGVILQTLVDQMQDDMNAWLTAAASLLMPLTLLHSESESEVPPPPLPPDEITSLQVQSVIATQRNRLRR